LPRHATWFGVRAIARTLARLTRTRLTVVGAPPRDQVCVHVANQQIYIDGPLMISSCARPVGIVVKGEIERHWYLRVPLRHLGVRFVDRFDHAQGLAQMRDAAAALTVPLMVFPEGTFKRMPGLLPFHLGAFSNAVAARAAIVPVAIHGTRSILRAGSWFPRRGAVTVTFGEPQAPDAALPPWSAALALRDAARRQILAACGEPDLAHESNVLDEI
jgi:1-acyl-sn-glycerol-3-phosphate acyltransferase